MKKNKKEDKVIINSKILVFSLLIIVGLLTLYPLSVAGFTTSDDLTQQLLALRTDKTFWFIAKSFAREQGRFFFLFSTYLILIPYLIDSVLYLKTIALGAIALNVTLLTVVGARIFKSWPIGALLGLIFFAFLQNSWEHNLVNAYPLVFPFSVSMVLVSLLALTYYFNNSNKNTYWISVGCYFLSLLTYEVFLMYGLIIGVYGFSKIYTRDKRFKKILIEWIKFIFPFFAAALLYVVLYGLFLTQYPSRYDGNVIGKISLPGFFNTVYQFGISSFPLYFYFQPHYRHFIADFSMSLTGDRRHPFFILTNIELVWLIKAGLTLIISLLILNRLPLLKLKKTIGLLLVGLVMVFFPAVILGVTNKYQQWTLSKAAVGFTVTYMAYFGTVLFFVILIWFFISLLPKHKYIRAFGIAMISLAIVMLGIVTDYNNQHITEHQEQNQLTWKAMKYLIDTKEFSEIPEGSGILAPSIYNYMIYPSYWMDWLKIKTGKTVYVEKSLESIASLAKSEQIPGNMYFLQITHEPIDDKTMMLLAPLSMVSTESGTLNMEASEAYVYTRANNRKYSLLAELVPNRRVYEYWVDGKKYSSGKSTLFTEVNQQWPGFEWIMTKLQSEKINPTSIAVSFFTYPAAKLEGRITQEIWDAGCFEKEGDEVTNWHWCSSEGRLQIVNLLPFERQITVEATLKTYQATPSVLSIESNDFSEDIVLTEVPYKYSKNLTLPPGRTQLLFKSTAERYAPEDPRDIRFGLFNFQLKEDINYD